KYSIPQSKNIKKALSKEELKKIFGYTPKNGGEERAKDFWIMSYLCNGINMKDIAKLRNRNISKNSIQFIRSKTEMTARRSLKPVVVYITPQIRGIIGKWRTDNKKEDAYVFPILNEEMTPENEVKTIG